MEEGERLDPRVIRRLKPEDLPAYMEIYLNAYPAGKDLSEECYEKYYRRNLLSMQSFDDVNFFGCFEGATLVATMKLIDFKINLFGMMRRATGLMALAVHPMYKRRGIAREMVGFFERYTKSCGAAIALLLPFRIDFYKNLGFGYGSKLEEYHLPTRYLPKSTDTGTLRFLGKGSIEEVLRCHRDYVRLHHGQLEKFREEEADLRSDDTVRRIGCFEGDRLKGYAAFTFERNSSCNYTLNRMDVKELIYSNVQTLHSLLAGLAMQEDLAQTVVLRSGDPDFYHLLQNPQDISGNYIDYGFLQTNVAAVGTMYKIVDVRIFVKETSQRRFLPMDFIMAWHLREDGSEKEQVFALRWKKIDEHHSTWSYEEEVSTVDVTATCLVSDFSALMMGSANFASLVRLGLIRLSHSEYVEPLDYLFHVQQKPFTNTDY